jgi:TatA/E family protein of Tat protein translocase
MGPIGVQEMIFIFVLALLLFGPKKMPELGRLLGKGLAEFRRAKNELKTTFESHMREIEREAQLEKSASQQATTDYSPTRPYSYPYDELGQTYENSESNSSNGFYNDSLSEPPVPTLAEAHAEPEPYPEPEPAHAEAEPHAGPERVEVPGTVPRLNGTQPVEHVSFASEPLASEPVAPERVASEEDHRA